MIGGIGVTATEPLSTGETRAPQLSLSAAAARNPVTTTKSIPQMQGTTSRWLVRMLPWIDVGAGTYRVNRRGTYPQTTEVEGRQVQAWRGVPLLPSDKIPISDNGTSSILCMRTGEQDSGVVGLHQTGIPDEYQPGLSARFMGINDQAVISYLVSTYFSAAVLVPDALGVLEHVETNR